MQVSHGAPTALHAAVPPKSKFAVGGGAVIGSGGRWSVHGVVRVLGGGVKGIVQARRCDGCASVLWVRAKGRGGEVDVAGICVGDGVGVGLVRLIAGTRNDGGEWGGDGPSLRK